MTRTHAMGSLSPRRLSRPAATAVALLLALRLPLPAQDVAAGGEEGITLRGIVSAVLFANDQLLAPGNGQNALWAALPGLDEDAWYHGADVRGTRLGLDFTGPAAFGDWQAGGTVEVDFFGGFPGGGTLSDEQPMLRLRLAYADLTKRPSPTT